MAILFITDIGTIFQLSFVQEAAFSKIFQRRLSEDYQPVIHEIHLFDTY